MNCFDIQNEVTFGTLVSYNKETEPLHAKAKLQNRSGLVLGINHPLR